MGTDFSDLLCILWLDEGFDPSRSHALTDPRIPEEKAAKVFERAAQLHAARNKGYSRGELTGAGEEVDLPAACIDQALAQLDAEEAQDRLRHKRKQWRRLAIRRTALVGGAILLGMGVLSYNQLSASRQRVDLAWAQVENQMQRRSDLIPTLLAATELGAQQQQALLTTLAEAQRELRSSTSPAQAIAADQSVEEVFAQVRRQVLGDSASGSNSLFTGLQDELAGTENRMAVERMRYNQAAAAYNQSITSFPTSVLAGWLGFRSRPLFRSTPQGEPTQNDPQHRFLSSRAPRAVRRQLSVSIGSPS